VSVRVGVMQLAGLASIGAGAIHAGAVGLHAEHTTLARLFVVAAIAQLGVGLLALVKGGRFTAAGTAAVNLGAVAAWGATRLWGIGWIDGLEQAEDPQFTDTACAVLGAIAATAAVLALVRRRTAVSTVRLGLPAFSVAVVALAAMLLGAEHTHGHDDPVAASGAGAPLAADGHDHGHDDAAASAQAADWPRPWDPAQPIDLGGVAGVTPEQELRATALVEDTLRELPAFADVDTLAERGYRSIGDANTGYEHFVDYSSINDDVLLDPSQPESLVFRVDGDERTLVSAMFIASERPLNDPSIVDFGGPLMQWHVHDNLCWRGGDDGPTVAAVTDAAGNCPAGTVRAGGTNPMVHVWIVAHPCGPFAALEGHGAGQAAAVDGTRADQCGHDDGHAVAESAQTAQAAPVAPAAVQPVPYDPDLPIDLSGTPGVTPEQQAFAENLVASTLIGLPQWADTATSVDAGFHSIGDADSGYEHFVQWDWIDDEVWLDPDHPESLVYRVEDDGTRTLASAMYMLPNSMPLQDVPDWGGALMQWHVHSDLCFDVSDPEVPRVGGLTDATGGCTAPLVHLGEAPMIHVWIVPHECGPFAALEGVGAGQVAAGETHRCDHAHGSVR
jgi:hypothetical protein